MPGTSLTHGRHGGDGHMPQGPALLEHFFFEQLQPLRAWAFDSGEAIDGVQNGAVHKGIPQYSDVSSHSRNVSRAMFSA